MGGWFAPAPAGTADAGLSGVLVWFDGKTIQALDLDRPGQPATIVTTDARRWDLSPDGSHVAYSSRVLGDGQFVSTLRVVRIDGHGARTIGIDDSARAEEAGEVRWSPDGRRIAWRFEDRRASDFFYCSERTRILDIGTGGSSEIQRPTQCASFSWSPDGTEIVTPRHHHAGGAYYTPSAEGSSLVRIDVTTQARRPLVGTAETETLGSRSPYPASLPAWAPTGDTIAYRWNDEIRTIGAHGTGVRVLHRDEHLTRRPPSWSPDGHRLAIVHDDGRITVVDRTGRRIWERSGLWGDPKWTSDGRWLVVGEKRRFVAHDVFGGRAVPLQDLGFGPVWGYDVA